MNNTPRQSPVKPHPREWQEAGPGEEVGAVPGGRGAGGPPVLPEVGASAVSWALEPDSAFHPTPTTSLGGLALTAESRSRPQSYVQSQA